MAKKTTREEFIEMIDSLKHIDLIVFKIGADEDAGLMFLVRKNQDSEYTRIIHIATLEGDTMNMRVEKPYIWWQSHELRKEDGSLINHDWILCDDIEDLDDPDEHFCWRRASGFERILFANVATDDDNKAVKELLSDDMWEALIMDLDIPFDADPKTYVREYPKTNTPDK